MSLSFQDVAFEHWQDCRLISNGLIELVAPGSFGLRLMRCGLPAGRIGSRFFDSSTVRHAEKFP